MAYNKIYRLIEKTIGLDIKAMGKNRIDDIVNSQMILNKLSGINEYHSLLINNSKKLTDLMEMLLVSETWFFRDFDSFDFLQEFIKTEWKPASSKSILRVLSIPCSTGEEAYSIAISLLESGLKPNELLIDAVDISINFIEKAKHAIYGSKSFINDDNEFRNKYFLKAEDVYIMNPKIASLVNFINANITQAGFLKQKQQYDIIFFRNLISSFNGSSVQTAVNHIKRLLHDDGIIFSYTSEIGILREYGFTQIEPLELNLCKKDKVEERAINLKNKNLWHRIKNIDRTFSKGDKELNSPITYGIKPSKRKLEKIVAILDKGQVIEAEKECKILHSANNSNPDLLYLMGLIFERKGDIDKAEEFFHKALYIEPYHYEALIHLIQLFEQKGWSDRASFLKQRIDKIVGKQFSEN